MVAAATVVALVTVLVGARLAPWWAWLASRFPDRWAGASAEAVSAECRALGLPSVNVKSAGQVARGCRAVDIGAALDAR